MGVVAEGTANAAYRPRICTPQIWAPPLLGRGFPGFSAESSAEATNLITSKMRDRVKGGRQAARRSGGPNGALLNGRCCGGRGECHKSPPDMYAADVGAVSGRGFPWLYRGGFGGSQKSTYKQNGERVKDGRQSARRIGRLNEAGAAASRRRTVR